MKRVALLLVVVLATSFCSKKEEAAKEGDSNALPDGIVTFFDPADRILKPGAKLRMWVENKTGEEYKFEWIAEGKCGELEFNQEKAFEARFVAGKLGEDCNEKITLKMVGPKGASEIQKGVKVEGSAKFAELEVRPNPIPDNWKMVNDYDKTMEGQEVKCVTVVGGEKKGTGLAVEEGKKRKKTKEEEEAEKKAREGGEETEIVDYFDDVELNLLDAPFGPWNFEFANCYFGDAPEGEEGTLAFVYDLPHNDDFCGYFENLALGKDCETQPFDTSAYTHVTFIVKSGDEKKHKFYAEMVSWERFAEFHQGRPEVVGPMIAGPEWERHEIPLDKFYKDTLNPSTIKSMSFKVKREANFPDHGKILFDNVAFVNKGEE